MEKLQRITVLIVQAAHIAPNHRLVRRLGDRRSITAGVRREGDLEKIHSRAQNCSHRLSQREHVERLLNEPFMSVSP